MKSVAEIVLERISQGAATSSAEGNVTYANERLAALAGVSRASLLGMPLASLPRIDSERQLIRALLAAARRGSVECRITLGRTSLTRRVLVTAAPMHGETICLFTDLTAATQREAADAAVRRFVGGLAEELDDLLAPILRSTDALKRTAGLDDGIRREVAQIETCASRALQRTADMRAAAGRSGDDHPSR